MAPQHHRFTVDLFALTKPKITLMAMFLAWAGLLHARASLSSFQAIVALLAIGALVSGSSALNMYFERDLDKKMLRTKDRPLPSGRLDAKWGVVVGVFCSSAACFLFIYAENLLTLILGLIALLIYVFCYTPMKQRSWLALVVGSIPGAMPVMLGYAASAHTVDAKALALFSWAFLWQIPHFLAISLFREQEYTDAGFPVLSAESSIDFAKKILLLSSWLLVFSTVGLYLTGVIGFVNLIICLVFGAVFLFVCHHQAFSRDTHAWARRAFRASLVYQGLLFIALVIDAVL